MGLILILLGLFLWLTLAFNGSVSVSNAALTGFVLDIVISGFLIMLIVIKSDKVPQPRH